MKKTLIVPVVAAMLAVSCGSDPTPVKDWSKEIKDYMTAEIGEVLPYIDFDAETLVFTHEADEYGGYAHAYDDNTTDLVATYGEKLVEAGFVFEEEADEYYKANEKAEIWVSFSYFQGGDPTAEDAELPGNMMHVDYLYVTAPEDDWDADTKTALTTILGEPVPFAFFDEETVEFYNSYTEGDFEGELAITDESPTSALVSYGRRLEKAGYELTLYGYAKQTDIATIFVEADWYEATDQYPQGNEIYVSYEYNSVIVNEFPAAEITEFFETYVVEDEYPVPEFASKTEGAYYEKQYTLDYVKYTASFDVYTYGATPAELKAYAYALVDQGWFVCYASEDFRLYNPEKPGLFIDILDYSSYEEPVTGQISFCFDMMFEIGYENAYVALTMAMRLGLDPTEVKDVTVEGGTPTFAILTSIKGTVAEVKALADSIVPADYYFFSEDMSTTYYSEEDPTVIEGYDNIFVVDGYEQGLQYVETMMYPNLEVEGEMALIIYVGGAPLEITWTAKDAMDEFFATYQLSWEPDDYTEDYGVPAFGTGVNFGEYTDESVNGVKSDVNLIMSKYIKGFTLSEDWTATELTDGTPAEECLYFWENDEVQVQFIYLMYNNEGNLILEVMTLEVPKNAEAGE